MKAAAGALALLAAAPCFAQAAGQWHAPAQIWGASCGYCHGAGVGPELRGRPIDPAALRAIVRGGLPGMPSFHPSELSDAEIAGLARWLTSAKPPAPPRR